MEFRNDNFNLNKKGVSLKFTGRSINDINVNNSNGIGIQLINNQVNNREFAFIDTYNVDNDFYSKLKIGFNNSTINIRNLNEINQIQSLNFNNSLTITNYVGIGSTTPKSLLDVAGRISCYDINIGGIILNRDYLLNVSSSVDNITSGILKIANGGTGASSFKSDQLLFGNFQQSPNLVWKEEKRRLGIGLTDPLYNIDVNGGINAFSYKILGNDINNIFIKPNDLLLSSNEVYNNCYNTSIISCKNYADNVGADLIYRFNQTVSDWTMNGNDIIYINSKVGIGTNIPLTSLHVVGDINYTGNLRRNGVVLQNFSGNYNDLTNVPKITWELSNGNIYNLNTANVGIGTSNPRSKLDVNGDINFTGNLRSNGNIINFFSGDYNDLFNIPSYSTVAYSGSFNDITEKPYIFSGNYEDLLNKPKYFITDWNSTIYNIPTFFPADWNISIKNKPKYFLTDWITSIDNKPLTFDTDWKSNVLNKPDYFPADWETTVINKPNTFYTDWNSNIKNKPNFATVAFTGQYSNILNKPFIFSGYYRELKQKPNYAKVAFTGNYNDLINRPNLFSGNFNNLKNIPAYFPADWNSTIINIPDFSRVAYTGLYNDIIGIPNILWKENNSNIYNCNIGNVGIGTSNPNYKLDVRGTFNVDGALKIDGIKGVFLKNIPWGAYFAEDYVVGSTILPDSSGNGRHATTSANITKTTASGNGATGAITYISGGVNSTITWPEGSIPSGFTILSLTRFTGSYRFQILKDKNSNSYYGHNISRGVFQYTNRQITSINGFGIINNWLYSTFKSYGTSPNNIIADGISRSVDNGGVYDPGQLFINNNSSVASDWAFGCVVIWDKLLSDADMLELNVILQNNLRDGGSTKSLFIDNNYKIYFNTDTYFNNDIFLNNINISNVFANSNDFIRTSNWVINGTNIYNVNTGSIGIGTTNPSSSYKLDVNGAINSSGFNITGNGGLFWSSIGATGIGCASVNGELSSSSLVGDMIIRSQEGNRLILQNGNNTGTLFVYNNKIGIGTNNPSSILHIYKDTGELKILFTDGSTGTTSTDGFAIFKSTNNDGNIWNYENSSLRFATYGVEKMCILADGKIGIGTTQPNSLLHLHNTSSPSEIKISFTDASTGIGTTIPRGFAIYKASNNDGYVWNYENLSLRFGTNNLERMTILNDGKIGIGTNNPNSLLHLHNSIDLGEVKLLMTDASTTTQTSRGFSIFKSGSDEGNIWNYENAPIRFATYGVERMCILADGKIGIGTNNPNSLLHLHTSTGEVKIIMTDASTGIGTTNGFTIYKASNNDGYVWNYSNYSLRFGTNNLERMTILSDGKIGINKINPDFTLDVNGTINATYLRGDGSNISNLNLANFSSSGVLSVSKGGTGLNSLNSNQILIGNGTNAIRQSANLIWDNTNNCLGINKTPQCNLDVTGSIRATSFYGDGANITNINATNISLGFLTVSKGGIGTSILNSNQILIGDGTNAIRQSANLIWDNTNNCLGINKTPQCNLDVAGSIRATSFYGDGANITNLSYTNLSGTLPVSNGGSGKTFFYSNQLLLGDYNTIYQTSNIIWDNTNNRLGINTTSPQYTLDVSGGSLRADIIIGDGANINGLNASYISTGILPVNRGGTGLSIFNSNQILIGDGANTIKQYANFVWNNTSNRLGINTNTPQYTLDVYGDINFTGVLTQNGNVYNASQTNTTSYWVASATNIYYISGNVGIGTNAPSLAYKLDVNGKIKCSQIDIGTTTSLREKTLTLNNTNDGTLSQIIFNYSPTYNIPFASISYSNGLMTFYNRSTNVNANGFYFSGASYVGIGVNPEKGLPLKVASGTNSITGYYYYFTQSTTIGLSNKTWNNISAYFDSHILVNGDIIITSDNRIKKNINDINSKNSLNLLSKINPKSFKYIDFIEKEDKNNYGFIAQDIKEIIPEAVGYIKEYIPNIFKIFDIKDDIIQTNEDLTLKLSINDNIKIINKDKKENYKIIEISSNYIKIDKKIEGDKCFVYGKEINDFHILDKDIIFTLNVSATQELNKKVKKQKKKIKNQQDKIKEHDEIIKEREIKLKEYKNIIDLLLANK